MFDILKKKLNETMNNLSIKQDNIKEEIFNSLLEAEVCYDLAEKISNETVSEFKVTNNYKTALFNSIQKNINNSQNNLKKGIILFVGFQGHGKTTTVNKLANRLIKQKFKVAVTTLDFTRPASIEQLEENSNRFKIDFLSPIGNNINEKTQNIKNQEKNYDYIIVDTQGLESNNTSNIQNLINILHPSETIFIINSMLGHSMFTMIDNIKHSIKITGAIMTNIDGDKKGGGFLSFYYLVKVPIMFITNGEKINHIESFNPKSITNIIMGEMDIEGLTELVENNIPKNIEEIFLNKIMNGIFTFNELIMFTTQTSNIGFGRIAASIGMNNTNENTEIAKKNIKIMTAVVKSMTNKERNNQVVINESRMERIGKGSGYNSGVVKQIIESYEKTKTQILMLVNIIKRGGGQDEVMNMLKGLMGQNGVGGKGR
jgi:signal recognition particle subunit SRP54